MECRDARSKSSHTEAQPSLAGSNLYTGREWNRGFSTSKSWQVMDFIGPKKQVDGGLWIAVEKPFATQIVAGSARTAL